MNKFRAVYLLYLSFIFIFIYIHMYLFTVGFIHSSTSKSNSHQLFTNEPTEVHIKIKGIQRLFTNCTKAVGSIPSHNFFFKAATDSIFFSVSRLLYNAEFLSFCYLSYSITFQLLLCCRSKMASGVRLFSKLKHLPQLDCLSLILLYTMLQTPVRNSVLSLDPSVSRRNISR